MAKPQEVEVEALKSAGKLLQFAAENKQVPENVVPSIATAWEAAEGDRWTPEVSVKFWAAYNALCAAVRPASLDSIVTTNAPTKLRFLFWRPSGTKAKFAARLWLTVLLFFLLLAIVLQFVVSTAMTLASEIDKLNSEIEQVSRRMTQDIAPLRAVFGTRKFSEIKLTSEQAKLIDGIQADTRRMWVMQDRVANKLKQSSYLIAFGRLDPQWTYGTLEVLESVEEFDATLLNHHKVARVFSYLVEDGSLIVKVISTTVLPLLLGIVGACAYVTRLISEQIKDSTFTATSAVRHLVRVALGALAGVVVGLGWIGTGNSASPSALAFIAGYAVEPVFATIDGIAEKFRRA